MGSRTITASCIFGTALLMGAAWGCDSGASPGGEAVPAEPNTARPKSRSADPGPSYADEDLPVPADFEAKADEEITSDNYEEILAELEAELDDKPDGGADSGAPDAAPKPSATPTASPSRPPPAKSTATVKPKGLPPAPPSKTP